MEAKRYLQCIAGSKLYLGVYPEVKEPLEMYYGSKAAHETRCVSKKALGTYLQE